MHNEPIFQLWLPSLVHLFKIDLVLIKNFSINFFLSSLILIMSAQ